jgi:hypothetical protein
MLARVPAYGGTGKKVSGILDAGGSQIDLVSGYTGPAQAIPFGTRGFNNIVRSHVEAHAAAVMRLNGLESASLYLNKAPCAWAQGCANMLPRMLPAGATLHIYWPGGLGNLC